MKKTLALLLALTMVFALAACGGQRQRKPQISRPKRPLRRKRPPRLRRSS